MQPEPTTTGSGYVAPGPTDELAGAHSEIAGGPESTPLVLINAVDWMSNEKWLLMRRDSLRARIRDVTTALGMIDRALAEIEVEHVA